MLKPPGKRLTKRALRTPADYGGNVVNFFLSQYNLAEKLDIDGTRKGHSTGFVRDLMKRRYGAGVGGLFGCTSVIVVSTGAMWISHFWERPSFRIKEYDWNKPRSAADIGNFNYHVIHQMENGGPNIPGLTQLSQPGGAFDVTQEPVWAIVTPRDPTNVVGKLNYEPEVDEIKNVLTALFPTAPPEIIDYEPKDAETSEGTANGKILFQYDPCQGFFCGSSGNEQGATFRLWFEDRPDAVWMRSWKAMDKQIITDVADYNSH